MIGCYKQFSLLSKEQNRITSMFCTEADVHAKRCCSQQRKEKIFPCDWYTTHTPWS